MEILRPALKRGTLGPARDRCTGIGPRGASPGPTSSFLGQALRTEVQRLFRHSLRLRHPMPGRATAAKATAGAAQSVLRYSASARHRREPAPRGRAARDGADHAPEEAVLLTDEATPRRGSSSRSATARAPAASVPAFAGAPPASRRGSTWTCASGSAGAARDRRGPLAALGRVPAASRRR